MLMKVSDDEVKKGGAPIYVAPLADWNSPN
jgi:hypothetical protein